MDTIVEISMYLLFTRWACIIFYSQEVKTCEIVKEEKIAEQVKIAQKLRAKDGSRIVNGYNVDKRCMSRPWIVFIRSEPS